MTKKIIGWILLAAGVLLIIWAVYSSFQIFTSKKPAPEIFKPQTTQQQVRQQGELQQQMESAVSEQLKKILPAESIPELLNLIAWSVFVYILIFAGGKIAFIGIKLLK